MVTFLATILQDLRYALRQLRSNPGFTAIAALTLALGIGTNTSIFSLLNALLLRPLAVPDSANVVAVYRADARPSSYPDFLDFEQRTSAFSGISADLTNESALDVGDVGQVVLVEAVSYNYSAVLKVRPILGRWFSRADDEHSSDPFSAVISYRTWQSQFAGDPAVIGKPVRLEAQQYTVIGVAPKEFPGMALPVMTELWVPLVSYARHNKFAAHILNDRQDGKVMIFGRLKPHITASEAQAQMNSVDTQLRREFPRSETRAVRLRVETARGTSDPGYRRMVAPLLVLLAAVAALVLLITCANVANLLLARGFKRRREVSIRLALGASRARICQQMLVESLLLSFMGSLAGLAAAAWTNRLLERALSSAPSPETIGADLAFDGRVFAFVLLTSLLTTVLCGLLPAWRSSKPDLVPALKGTAVFLRNSKLNLRNLGAVAQVTVSLVLLIMAGLFLRALRSASHIDPGIDARNLLSARLYIAPAEFNPAAGQIFYRNLVERIRGLPGVRNATLSYASPTIAPSECVVPANATSSLPSTAAGSNTIGYNYFSTLGIPIIHGRDFISSDKASAPPVVIVNETLAHQYWPGQDPIGQHIRFGNRCDQQGEGTLAEIVGVANNSRYPSLDPVTRPYIFIPLDQRFVGYLALIVQTSHNPAAWADTLRKELHASDGRLHVYEIDALLDQIDKSLWQARWEASLVGVFGALALMVASVGLYGVIAFAVTQRTREFGIRLAVGAQRREILQLVTTDALVIALTGVALGVIVSLASTKLLRSLLYGLSPTDTPTFAAAAFLWTAVALLASGIPAYRATKVDPLVTLRDE